MLLALRISNFTVIEEVEVGFGPGLNVLTGETGAGKSILVDALGLLLGGRADPACIRTGCEEATVEGVMQKTPTLVERLCALGLPDLGEEVSLRRVVGQSGRGKAYVNGALVTVGVLTQLMKGLIDIAGQHEHVGLFDPSHHRVMVDRMGGLLPDVERYQRELWGLKELEARIEALGGDERKAQERLSFLRFQMEELESLSPRAGEDVELEAERRRLSGAERLVLWAQQSETLLSGEDGAAERIGRALQLCQDGLKVDAGLAPMASSLTAALSEAEEAARALSRYAANLDSDPARLAEVDERLDLLKRLCRRHGTDLAGVLQRREAILQEAERLERRDEQLLTLSVQRDEALLRVRAIADSLTRERRKAAEVLTRTVQEGLVRLAMPKAVFEARVCSLSDGALRADGQDSVELLFTANPGEAPRPLAKVASGGEASRLLLALKRGLADLDLCHSYVLDEADAGVSGAVAEVVGQMVREVGKRRQVLCITHLPQVAAFGDAHFRIEKRLEGGRTASRVIQLSSDERTLELARMLSGVKVTREAVGAAEALLRSARRVPRISRTRSNALP